MGAAKQAGDGRTAQAAQRTLDVLEFFEGQSAPVTAADIAAACGIPRSSLYNLLRMLRARDYVAYRRSDGGWVCGERLLDRRGYGFPFADGLAVAEVIAAASRGLTTADVAARSSLPPEVVAGILVTLARSDVVATGADGTWHVGPRLVALESLFGWTERLKAVARPILVRLRDGSGETASLVTHDGDDVLYLDQVESLFELRCGGWAGRRVSRFGTSAGAAFDDPSQPQLVADAVEAGVTAITCAAAGITPAVGVNVIGPSWRMAERGVDELIELVRAAAAELAAAYSAGRTKAH